MPDLNLDEIEKRYEKATPGEWGWSQQACYHTSPGIAIYSGTLSGKKSIRIASIRQQANTVLPKEQREANADFIAHARADIPALVAEVKRLRSGLDTEKAERVYYQDIVYSVCCTLDAINGNKVSLGEGVVCGTSLNPTRQVQDAMRRLLPELCGDAPDAITLRLEQARANALEEAAKICKLAKCRADYDPVLDGCAEKIRALKTKGE